MDRPPCILNRLAARSVNKRKEGGELMNRRCFVLFCAALAGLVHGASNLPRGSHQLIAPRATSAGYLVINDWGRDSVLRFDAATGAFVDTFVPNRSGGLNQPWGVLFGPHDGNLYVSCGEFHGP